MPSDETVKRFLELHYQLAAFCPMGLSGIGTCYWFRRQGSSEKQLLRVDGEGSFHFYTMASKEVVYADNVAAQLESAGTTGPLAPAAENDADLLRDAMDRR